MYVQRAVLFKNFKSLDSQLSFNQKKSTKIENWISLLDKLRRMIKYNIHVIIVQFYKTIL